MELITGPEVIKFFSRFIDSLLARVPVGTRLRHILFILMRSKAQNCALQAREESNLH